MSKSRRDGELVIAVHYEPSGVDPHIGAAELALQMTNACFDTLVVKTTEGDYLPALAERYEVSADEKRYTFHLRRDVRFHDGTGFNAAAVKFSLDRARDPANRSQLAGGMLGPYVGSEVIDDYTVAVQLSEPYALLLDSLSQGWLAPVSPLAVERLGKDFARAPVGTGPYIFEEWVAGSHIRLRRNPDYAWPHALVDNKGAASVPYLRFDFIAAPAARTAALEAGEVDAVFYAAPADVARLRADARYGIDVWPIRGIPVCMMMNIARTPTHELAVRRAINHAIDQDALVAEVFHGEFARAYGPVSQFTLGYEPAVEQMYPFDLAKSRELLDLAGWKEFDAEGYRVRDGERLKLVFYALPVNFYPEFGVIVTRMLREVGIEVEVRLEAPVAWIHAGMRGEHHLIPQGKYASSCQLLSFVYHSRNSGPNGYGWSKRGADHHPGFDALLERAERTLPVKDFVPLYQKVQTTVMDEALIVPLHCNTNIVARRAGISGLKFDAIGAYPYFHDVVDAGEVQA